MAAGRSTAPLPTEVTGEILVAWKKYKACGPDEVNLKEGDLVELLDTNDPKSSSSSPNKRLKLDPELDVESSSLLDNSAAKHKLSVKPKRSHVSSRQSPCRTNVTNRWLVRHLKGDKKQGWVPCQILQTADDPTPETGLPGDAAFRRMAVISELIETEQEFVRDVEHVVQKYMLGLERDPKKVPKTVKDNMDLIFGNLYEIAEFHKTVLIEGVKYYAEDPLMLGKTFLRLERDFDKHVAYCVNQPLADAFLEACDEARDYFEEISQKLGDDKTLSEHLKLPIQRINDYQLLLRELVRYTACLREDNNDLERALELMLSVPHRAQDDKFTSSIEGYRGSIHKLGRLLAHDWFQVQFGEFTKERYLFLFKARILICKVRRVSEERSVFQLKDTIRLTQVEVRDFPDDDKRFTLIDKETGNSVVLIAHRENVKNYWLKEIREFATEFEESSSEEVQVTAASSTPSELSEEVTSFKESVVLKTASVEVVDVQTPVAKKPKLEEQPKVVVTKPAVENPTAKKPAVENPKPAVVEPEKKASTNNPNPSVVEKKTVEKPASAPAPVAATAPEKAANNKPNPAPKPVENPVPKATADNPGPKPVENPVSKPFDNPGPPKVEQVKANNPAPAPVVQEVKANNPNPAPNPAPVQEVKVNNPNPAPVAQEVKAPANPSGGNPSVEETPSKSKQSGPPTFPCKPGDNPRVEVNPKTGKVEVIDENLVDVGVGVEVFVEKDMSRKYTESYGGSYSRTSYSGESSRYGSEYGSGSGSAGGEIRSKYSSELSSSRYDTGASGASKYGSSSAGKYDSLTSSSSKYESGSDSKYDAGKYEALFSSKYVSSSSEGGSKYESSTGSRYESLGSGGKDGGYSSRSLTHDSDGYGSSRISARRSMTSEGDADGYSSYSRKSVRSSERYGTGGGDDDYSYSSTTRKSLYGNNDDDDYTSATRKSRRSLTDDASEGYSYKRRSLSSNIDDNNGGEYRSSSRRKSREDNQDSSSSYTRRYKSLDSSSETKYTHSTSVDESGTGAEDNCIARLEAKYRKKQDPEEEEPVEIDESYSVHKYTEGIVTKRSSSIDESSEEKAGIKYTKQKSVEERKSLKQSISIKEEEEEEAVGGGAVEVKVEAESKSKTRTKSKTETIQEESEKESVKTKAEKERKSSTSSSEKKSEELKRSYSRSDSSSSKKSKKTSISEEKSEKKQNPMAPTEEKPAFVETLIGKNIEPGQSAVFEVALSETPDSLTWLKDNKALEGVDAERIIMSSHDDNHVFRLEIKNATFKDMGQYTAVAGNCKGKATCTSHLIVHELTPEQRAELNKPVFLVSLKDTQLIEDTYLRFMVKVKGDPKPTIAFYKDDKAIGNAEGRLKVVTDHSEHGFYELVIPDVKFSDAGKYKCVATNKFGESSTEATVTVTDAQDVFDQLLIEAGLLRPGERPTFIWKKDGIPFEPEERFKVLLGNDEDSLALVFQHVKPEDAGLYTCVAQTSSGHISCSAELTVHGTVNQLNREPEKPSLIIESKEAIVNSGGTQMIELKCKGFPKPNVKFTHEGQPCEPGSKYKILYEDEENISLVIKNIEPADAGKYECTAENELGADTAAMNLVVKKPPKILTQMKDMSVSADELFKMTVEIEGIPKPKVQFYKDGKEISSSDDRMKVVDEGNDKYSLVIDKTKLTDTGSYSVVASNELAQVSQFWKLDVFTKPKILQKLGPAQVVDQAQQVALKMKIEAVPAPEITWYLNEKEITESEHVKMVKEGDDTYILKISGAVTTDSGDYKAKVKNIHGTVLDETRVDVKCAPKIIKHLVDMTVTENDKDIVLDVEVEAFPKPKFKWFLDEMEISESRNEFTRIESDNGAKLVIKEVSSELHGQYTCKVVNDLGFTESSAKLTVNCKPKIIKHLKDTVVEEGSTLHLEVEVDACPEPTVKWLRNGQEISADAHIKITRDHKRKETFNLEVNLIKYEEQGEYEVVFVNSLGTVSSKSNVTVHKVTHSDAVEMTGEPPKKIKVDVEVEEKAPSKVQIEEIIETSDDSGSVYRRVLIEEETIVEEQPGSFSFDDDGNGAEMCAGKMSRDVSNITEIIAGEDEEWPGGIYIQGESKTIISDYEEQYVVIDDDDKKPKRNLSAKIYEVHEKSETTVSDSSKIEIIDSEGNKTEIQRGKEATIESMEVYAYDKDNDEEKIITSKVKIDAKPKKSISASVEEADWIEQALSSEDKEIINEDIEKKKPKKGRLASIELIEEGGEDDDFGKHSRRDSKLHDVDDNESNKKRGKLADIESMENIEQDGEDDFFGKSRRDSKITDVDSTSAKKAPMVSEIFDDENENEPEDYPDLEPQEIEQHAQEQDQEQIKKHTDSQSAVPKIRGSNMEDRSQYESLDVSYVVKCHGNPKPVATWTVDGKPITPGSHLRMSVSESGNEYKLEIKKLEMKDAGVYQCVLSNPLGEAKQQAKLTVIPEAELRRPKIREPLEDTETKKKDKTVLSAVIVGDPVPDVAWYFEDKEMTALDFEKSKIELNVESVDIEDGLKESKFSLTIPRTERSNMGKYKIKAKNKWGEAECSAALTVVLVPEIEGPYETVAVPGDSAEFSCIVQACPVPKVTWSKDDVPIENGEMYEIQEDVKNEKYKLIIKEVALHDEGNIRVTAKNKMGETSSEAKLKILKEPDPLTEKPRFITGLSDTTVQHGGEVDIMVRADGLPKPQIRWYMNGKPIDENDCHEIDTHVGDTSVTSTLSIADFNMGDVGFYKVVAVNVVGEAETTAQVHMLQTPPSFTKRLERSQEVNEGEPLLLKAKVNGSPKPTVAWYKDGELINPDDERIKTELLDDGTVKLSIEKMRPEDSGAYKLVVRNANGETAGLCAVAVNQKPERPKFLKCFKDQKVPPGEQLRLEAVIKGHPPPEIKWMKDGLPVRASSNIHFEQHPDGRVALVVDNMKPENIGKYTLIASNKMGESTADAEVELEKKPKKPEFLSRLTPQTAVEGFPVKFEVKVAAFPAPTITWMRNGAQVIPDGKHIKIVNNEEEGTSALLLDACDPVVDALTYKAIASNEAGDSESAAPLTVTPANKPGEPEERPIFMVQMKDAITDEGCPLILEAPFTGNPIPTVQWTKDGVPIEPSDRILLTCDGRRVGLHIDHALPSDAGRYGVTITNPLGTDSSEAKASVHKVYSPPRFTQTFTDLQQLPEHDAKFPARVSGVPQPEIQWFKDDKPLRNTDKYKIKRDGDTVCLYVNNCEPEDEGVYKVVATNKEGQDSCSAKLEVVKEIKIRQKMEAPSFLKKIGDTELFKGMTAKFTACATGFPEPKVEWFRNDQKLYPSDRIRMEMDRAGLLRLTISGLDQDDLGKYSCKISNEHGSDICHATLRFDEMDSQKRITDQYEDFDKLKKSGVPIPLSDAPIISRMTDKDCTISWKPSIPHGPRPPVTYMLEMQELPNGDWFTYKSGLRNCVCDVDGLKPFRDYKFRVRVENKYGISDPSPYVATQRERLEPELPKFEPYLPEGSEFRPDSSPYFPKDFDIERPPHDNMAQAPYFLKQTNPTQYGIKDQSTNINWFVYGYPKPKMQYYFNDELIESGGRFDNSYTRNGQATLFINKMLDRDVGWYEAVATNEHGEARQRVRLEIAEHPRFIRRPHITYCMVRDKARMEAQITGNPIPDIKWFKDWKPLADSSRTKIQFIEPDTYIIVINDAIYKDEGMYSISARNIAGSISSSAMLHIEDNDLDYNLHTYANYQPIKLRRKNYLDFYDLGDELGRGTQGVTYHAVERLNGRNYAAKIMHGRTPESRKWMMNEYEMMNQLCHRKLIGLHDAYEGDDSLHLIMELASGGELVKDYFLVREYYTESDVAGFIRQLLEGLKYMHEKGIGHMGLNLGDLLLSHSGSDNLKITDFSLARRIQMGRLDPLFYGVPEFASPEAVNKEGTGLGHDMWAVGIITYILLSGRSPFLGANDRETITRVQEGKWIFEESWWMNMSEESRDFIRKLLVYQAEGRMDVHMALRHPWLERADKKYRNEYRISTSYLRTWHEKFRWWYDNANCKLWYRRKPFDDAFVNPSKMIYPPGERDTPPPLPKAERVKRPRTWEDNMPTRSPLNYEVEGFRSESHYQNGPDTYLLQLRDVNFPVRIREYMKVAASRGPVYGLGSETSFDWTDPVIRERRRFTDVMDEEIDDERKQRINKYGAGDAAYSTRRLRHEIGTRLDAYTEAQAFIESKQEGRLPFFREKPQTAAMQEGKDLEITCLAVGDPKPIVQFFKNDGIVADSHRISITTDDDGRCHFKLKPALQFDQGMYRVVARNKIGQTVARCRIVLGLVPDEPDSPEAVQISDKEALLTWKQPKFDGNAPVICYSLQYKEADELEWRYLATNIDHEFYVVRDLQPLKSYIFRLAARNSIGWSEQGVPSAVVTTKAEGAPAVEITSAMLHLQQITESGKEVEEEQRANYDYNIELEPVDWQSAEAEGDYDFISELSRGRFSTVVKAISKKDDEVYVAKVNQLNAELNEHVEGEFAALRSLRHERIASLLAAYRTQNTATFILEKLQGADVLTYLASKHEYTEQTVALIVGQVLDGLQYLHWRGLGHLDLQPDNVVMCNVRSVQIKLVDFGNAHRVTKLGNKVPVLGHPDYIAPEILAEEPAFPQSDIWSVGVLTYMLLSGTVPFRGADENESRQNILFVRYQFEHLYKELSPEALRFIMLVFKRHPNKRPTAEECHENRWLLPTDFMIKKRDRAVFLGNRLKAYCDEYHAKKLEAWNEGSPEGIIGKSINRSNSITDELLAASP